jgi:hypothetical protein
MTEKLPSAIGTVAQEAARLIEDMATLARSSPRRSEASRPYDGGPAQEPVPPDAPPASGQNDSHPPASGQNDSGQNDSGQHDSGQNDSRPHDTPSEKDDPGPAGASAGETSEGVCATCGSSRDGTPVACRLCPVCQGIALMRSVRPETVDLLADLALAVAATLRDVATRSRASDQASGARPASGSSPGADRATVHDIPVDDDSEG